MDRAACAAPGTSFDGGRLVVVDADHDLLLIDALADRPRVLWRELAEVPRVHGLSRDPTSLTALVATAGARPRVELWRWDLPGMTLRQRTPVDLDAVHDVAVTSTGALGTLRPGPTSDPVLRWLDARGRTRYEATIAGKPAAHLLTSGPIGALRHASAGATRLEVAAGSLSGFDLDVRFPGADPELVGIRAHAGVVTCWDRSGRIVAVDQATSAVTCNLRTAV